MQAEYIIPITTAIIYVPPIIGFFYVQSSMNFWACNSIECWEFSTVTMIDLNSVLRALNKL